MGNVQKCRESEISEKKIQKNNLVSKSLKIKKKK